jgi:hypothetical protein
MGWLRRCLLLGATNPSFVMLALVASICARRDTRILTGSTADPWDKPKDDGAGE